MIAVLPMWMRDLVDAWPLVMAVLAFVGWLVRSIYKVLRKLDKLDKLDEIERIVRHHLGPNGETPPMWRRMERLEMAHDIETPAMAPELRERYPKDGAA